MAKLVLTLLFGLNLMNRNEPNVCNSVFDYAFTHSNPNCKFNPDVRATPEEIINNHGYPFESYEVTTEDNYILTVWRLRQKGGVPVLLQHGVACSGAVWLGLGNKSLPFELYDAGFDVWIGNYRGTVFSRKHADPEISEKDYWNFSWFEMGFYDLPAILELVAVYSQEKIIFIGHSMGTTTSYVYSIVKKEQAEKRLSAIISLGPVAYTTNFVRALTTLAYARYYIITLTNFFGIYHIGPENLSKQFIFSDICSISPINVACYVGSRIILAMVSTRISSESLPMLLSWTPTSTSLKTFNHFAQEAATDGKFKAYDYGSRNQEIYGSTTPPIFNVSEISVPVYMFYGKRDSFADEQDVRLMYRDLTTTKRLTLVGEEGKVDYDHLDFVFSSHIEYLYKPLFETLNEIVGN